MIINRYLLGEISRPLVLILGILVALFAGYSLNGFLSDAVNGLLPGSAIAELTALKVLIALEVLIPASLYVAVLVSFARLYGNSEFTAMFALSMRPVAIMRTVLTLAGSLAVVVGCLSLFVRPWAYQRLHALTNRAAALLDLDAVQPGSFYVDQNGARVIFVGHRAGPGAPARDVFVRLVHPDRVEIMSARSATTVPGAAPGSSPQVYLENAFVYEVNRGEVSGGEANRGEVSGGRSDPDQVLQADGMVIDPNSREGAKLGYSAVAASNRRLAKSGVGEDVAEFQWRLSTPLSTLLLGMLGVPLARKRPRENRYSMIAVAILAYFGYYLLFTSARTWVQHGNIARFPGIWWVPATLTLVVLTALYIPTLDFGMRRDRA